MAIARHFTAETLRMLSGIIVWGVHFMFVYVFTALACARRFHDLSWLGTSLVVWGVGIATLAAVAGILAFSLPAWLSHRRPGDRGTHGFLDWMTIAFGMLSLLAVLWVALPVLLVPIC